MVWARYTEAERGDPARKAWATKRASGAPVGATRERGIWHAMVQRCADSTNKYYGARGIRVCERWLGPTGFQHFMEDVGRAPSPTHSIDRVDNDGDYVPTNCRWATKKQQAANRRPRRANF